MKPVVSSQTLLPKIAPIKGTYSRQQRDEVPFPPTSDNLVFANESVASLSKILIPSMRNYTE